MPATKARPSKAPVQKKKTIPTRPRSNRWTVRSERVIELKAGAPGVFAVLPKLARIVESIGLSAAADVLGIDKSQLRRCLKGEEAISAELTRRITDIEYIMDRALQVMNPEEIGAWLVAPEALLGNSLPINVLTTSGPARVIRALDGIAAGVFA